jgi:hypothetical protein
MGAAAGDLVALYVGRLAPRRTSARRRGVPRDAASVRGALRFVVVGDGPLGAALRRASRPGVSGSAPATTSPALRLRRRVPVPERGGTFTPRDARGDGHGLPWSPYDYAAAHVHVENGDGVLAAPGDTSGFIGAAAALARAPELLRRCVGGLGWRWKPWTGLAWWSASSSPAG